MTQNIQLSDRDTLVSLCEDLNKVMGTCLLPAKIFPDTAHGSEDMFCDMISHAAWNDVFKALKTVMLSVTGRLFCFHILHSIL